MTYNDTDLEEIMCYEKVKQLICEQLGKSPDKVNMDTKIVEDLGADSLDVVEMLIALEDEFHISVPDEDAKLLTTVGALADYVDKKTQK